MIVGYSLKKCFGFGKFIQSATFTVGGYDWAIQFYPDGVNDLTKGYTAVYLVLVSKKVEVRASYVLSLVNQITGLPENLFSETTTRVSSDANLFSPRTPHSKEK